MSLPFTGLADCTEEEHRSSGWALIQHSELIHPENYESPYCKSGSQGQ